MEYGNFDEFKDRMQRGRIRCLLLGEQIYQTLWVHTFVLVIVCDVENGLGSAGTWSRAGLLCFEYGREGEDGDIKRYESILDGLALPKERIFIG